MNTVDRWSLSVRVENRSFAIDVEFDMKRTLVARTTSGDLVMTAGSPRRVLPLGTVCEHPCLCGGKMVLRDSKYGLFYSCANFPNCRGKVGAHQDTGLPLGKPADDETRAARIEAHEWFDKLWGKGEGIPKDFQPMKRGQAYAWLRRKMGLGKDETHIGLFDKAQCELVVELVKSKLARMR